jgi:hypothetical protein
MDRRTPVRTAGYATVLAAALGAAAAGPLAAAEAPAAAAPVSVPSAGQQIASAVLAAPEERRAGAEVLGYAAEGATVALKVLRAGTNDIICLADEPGDEKWSVACYHRSLEPFMKRGRELESEGVSGDDRMKRRWAEADAGTLAMPKAPATLYVLSGKGFDSATGKAIDPYLRYVVYTPYATQESTGLPLSPPGPGGPWIMFPGTAGAHIMITPPKEGPATPATPATPAKAAEPAKPATPPAGKDPRRR